MILVTTIHTCSLSSSSCSSTATLVLKWVKDFSFSWAPASRLELSRLNCCSSWRRLPHSYYTQQGFIESESGWGALRFPTPPSSSFSPQALITLYHNYMHNFPPQKNQISNLVISRTMILLALSPGSFSHAWTNKAQLKLNVSERNAAQG